MIGFRPYLFFLYFILFNFLPYHLFAQQPLTADLSNHLIAINTSFQGSDVVLFGIKDSPGDIIITVEGPHADLIVSHKEKYLGIWTNGETVVFYDMPSYYKIATSRKLEEIAEKKILKRNQIGADYLRFKARENLGDEQYLKEFEHALIRLKQKENLYPDEEEPVIFIGDKLFRANLSIPDNAPVGLYRVTTYLFDNGELISAQTTPLSVSKIGLNHTLYETSHYHPVIYAICIVIGASLIGLLSSSILKK